MIRLLEDNTVTDGSQTINSGHADKASDPLVAAIAGAFPYRPEINYERPASERIFEEVKFDGLVISWVTCICDAVEQSRNALDKPLFSLDRYSYERGSVDPLKDISDAPERVQTLAVLVFTADARAAFIESLTRVDKPRTRQEQAILRVPRMIDIEIPAVTGTAVIDGETVSVEITPAHPGKAHATEKGTRTVTDEMEIVDGNAVPVAPYEQEYDVPLFDEYPKLNADGTPDMVDVPALRKNGEQFIDTLIKYQGQLYAEGELV